MKPLSLSDHFAHVTDRRRFTYAFLAALSIHIAAYFYVNLAFQGNLVSDATSAPVTFKIEFSSPPAGKDGSPGTPADLALLEEVIVEAIHLPKENMPHKKSLANTKKERPPLAISKDDILEATRDYIETPEPAETQSENGALVFDSQLLTALNQAERSRPIVDFLPRQSFGPDGISIVRFFQFGDMCFRVNTGNPLEPMSHEMWYRVKCQR